MISGEHMCDDLTFLFGIVRSGFFTRAEMNPRIQDLSMNTDYGSKSA